jgi:hypothetical protein
MGTFENPDLCASAARMVCLNDFAPSVALRKKAGIDQPESHLAAKLRFLVYTPVPVFLRGTSRRTLNF